MKKLAQGTIAADAYPQGGIAFDTGMILCLSALFIGGYTDGWAHNNLPGLDSFFTPWHALLYSGFALSAAYLIIAAVRARFSGHDSRHCLPAGYEPSLAGVLIFGIGGVLDMFWHMAFGVEASIAATVSPTHLMLLLGVVLMYAGPLRAALMRGDVLRMPHALPMVLSAAYVWGSLTFFTQYASPFGSTFSAADFAQTAPLVAYFSQAVALAGLLLQTAFMMGIVLFTASRCRLPGGSLTLLLAVQSIAMGLMRPSHLSTGPLAIIVAALAAGIICDLFYAALRPSPERKTAWLTFATLMPFIVFGLYFATVTVMAGTWWTPHMLFGAPIEAAGVGYLVGWLTSRGASPTAPHERSAQSLPA